MAETQAEEVFAPAQEEGVFTPAAVEDNSKDAVDFLLESLGEKTFSLVLQKHPVKIKNEKGDVQLFSLWELDADQRSMYLNFQAQKARYSAEGKVVGIKDINGMETKLVALSLHHPDGTPVPESEVKAFPSTFISTLARCVARVSGLDDKAEMRAKNS